MHCVATIMVGPAAVGAPRLVFEGGVETGGCGQGVTIPAWVAT